MDKIHLQNLALIITNKCNLNCAHCMRGCSNNKDMSKSVIDTTLSQIIGVSNLSISGGEPTLALPTLEYIFNYIVNNRVFVQEVSLVINGSIYSEKFLQLLDYINEYMRSFRKRKKSNCIFTISLDKYHLEELKRLNLFDAYKENIKKYERSIHFYGYQYLKPNLKLFREGNACSLPENETIDLRTMNLFISYPGKRGKLDIENGLCNIGPIIAINTDGIVTECEASIENQSTIYNYGSIFDKSIEDICLEKGKVLKPRKWYKACCKETKSFKKYNK